MYLNMSLPKGEEAGLLLPAVAIVLVMLVVLALALLWVNSRRTKRLERQSRMIRQTLDQKLEAVYNQYSAEAQRNREESAHNLRGVSDSITQQIYEFARTQQAQLDSFSAQLRNAGRIEEERMESMRQSVEEKLNVYETRMDKISGILDEKLSQNEKRVEQMRQTVENKMEALQKDNNQKLEEMRLTVDEKLHATLDKRLGESFQAVSQRLERVYKGLGEMQTLASDVGNLQRVLTNVKTRGIWGEIQLGALLEQVLAPDQYCGNTTVKPNSTERVEFAVKLPGSDRSGEPVLLPIDAKFPQADYERLLEAIDGGDQAQVEQCGRKLEQAIKLEAKRIQDKYIEPPYTTDFAVMFLPVEGLYAEVLRRPGLFETLQQDHRVVVTGPTTLAALLNSLQMGFKTLAIERRSSEVWVLLGAVKTEFGRFADLLDKTQKQMHQASASIESATRKTRTIQRKLRDVQELNGQDVRRLLDEESDEELPEGADINENAN